MGKQDSREEELQAERKEKKERKRARKQEEERLNRALTEGRDLEQGPDPTDGEDDANQANPVSSAEELANDEDEHALHSRNEGVNSGDIHASLDRGDGLDYTSAQEPLLGSLEGETVIVVGAEQPTEEPCAKEKKHKKEKKDKKQKKAEAHGAGAHDVPLVEALLSTDDAEVTPQMDGDLEPEAAHER